MSVSNGKDQLVVFHTKDNKDLIVCLFSKEPSNDSRVGELVGVLASHFKRSVLHTHYSQIQTHHEFLVVSPLILYPCSFTTAGIPELSFLVFLRLRFVCPFCLYMCPLEHGYLGTGTTERAF